MKHIGDIAAQVAGQVVSVETHGNPSLVRLPTARPITGMPTTIEEARALGAWARVQPEAEPKATPQQIARHLEFLAATLPSRATDETSAKMRFAVYSRFLMEYSNAALAFMAREACIRFDWFPTPRQCLSVLDEYRAPSTDRDVALRQCQTYWQDRHEAWLNLLASGEATQSDIDAVPIQWRRIAVEHGHLRRDGDAYTLRRPAA